MRSAAAVDLRSDFFPHSICSLSNTRMALNSFISLWGGVGGGGGGGLHCDWTDVALTSSDTGSQWISEVGGRRHFCMMIGCGVGGL